MGLSPFPSSSSPVSEKLQQGIPAVEAAGLLPALQRITVTRDAVDSDSLRAIGLLLQSAGAQNDPQTAPLALQVVEQLARMTMSRCALVPKGTEGNESDARLASLPRPFMHAGGGC